MVIQYCNKMLHQQSLAGSTSWHAKMQNPKKKRIIGRPSRKKLETKKPCIFDCRLQVCAKKSRKEYTIADENWATIEPSLKDLLLQHDLGERLIKSLRLRILSPPLITGKSLTCSHIAAAASRPHPELGKALFSLLVSSLRKRITLQHTVFGQLLL